MSILSKKATKLIKKKELLETEWKLREKSGFQK